MNCTGILKALRLGGRTAKAVHPDSKKNLCRFRMLVNVDGGTGLFDPAAIGDDKENIQAIYQDEFLDISDLSKLPKIMTNIVKKRVLRNSL